MGTMSVDDWSNKYDSLTMELWSKVPEWFKDKRREESEDDPLNVGHELCMWAQYCEETLG